MNSEQYEELCRLFVAQKANVVPEAVMSVRIPNPKRPGLPEYQHQIDLYWETGDEIALYLNIANAKWRASEKIDQSDVMLLQQVRQKVAAHKAFMITNVGFTAGAVAAARDEGIALHVVAPNFDVSTLPKDDRAAILAKLQAMAAEPTGCIYSHRIEHRGLGFAGNASSSHSVPGRTAHYETRVIAPPAPRTTSPGLNRALGGGESRGGPGWSPGSNRGGGFVKK